MEIRWVSKNGESSVIVVTMAALAVEEVMLLFSRSVVSYSLRPHGLQHTRLLCPPLSPRVCSNSCLLSWWCYLTISSSARGSGSSVWSDNCAVFFFVFSWRDKLNNILMDFQYTKLSQLSIYGLGRLLPNRLTKWSLRRKKKKKNLLTFTIRKSNQGRIRQIREFFLFFSNFMFCRGMLLCSVHLRSQVPGFFSLWQIHSNILWGIIYYFQKFP